jgi:hypothetical protein
MRQPGSHAARLRESGPTPIADSLLTALRLLLSTSPRPEIESRLDSLDWPPAPHRPTRRANDYEKARATITHQEQAR